MSINRSGRIGFSETEKRALGLIRPHLYNLHVNLFVDLDGSGELCTMNRQAALTKRELEIFRLLLLGIGPRQIGRRLFISPRTVEKHTESIFDKFGVNSKPELLSKATSLGVAPRRS